MGKLKAFAALAFAGVMGGVALAACRCACVDGQIQSVCTQPYDVPALCSGACPVAPADVAPLQEPGVPPIGTSVCHQAQVLNPATGAYQWRTICQ